ncbi:MAG: pimeloyl-ACP methyl ester carboxylesterase [Planctomycetota bacterium]|jgi:pimeloyl-ACP methyl ester carboxylesterase
MMLHAILLGALSLGLASFAMQDHDADSSSPKEPLEFELVRPEGMADDQSGPVLIALPPGGQDRGMVEAGLQRYWRDEAIRLGWTVVSPVAPDGQRLHGDNLPRVFELIDQIEKRFSVEGGRVHLAGVSNGGRTAMELALAQPERFASLSLLPGMPVELDLDRLERLTLIPMAMYVGGDDAGWLAPMESMRARLESLGSPPARFTVFEGEGHTPKSLSGKTLFHTLESFRVHSALHDFHDAASKADGARYFAHFADGAIYMGTDASERWTVEAFRAFAEPYFSKGRGWTYVASERHVYVSDDGQSAWFDELLDNSSYGVTRGTGVFVRSGDRWRMAQYHLTIPMPNDLAKTFVEMIRKDAAAR